MLVFGCSITAPDVYARCAERGFRLVAEPDSEIIANAAAGSLFRSYNLILESAAKHEDLEAVVLVHQDSEIVDPDFARKLRDAFRNPEVAVVGCVGAIDVRSIAWWEGSVTWASFSHRYSEFGGGEVQAFTWSENGQPGYARTGEVDTLDGFVLCMSPWAVRNVRFDEDLGSQIHGYDLDYCLQVREAGRKVATADFKVVHHHSLELVDEVAPWIEAYVAVADKWEGRMPGIGRPNYGSAPEDWKRRALRAEAEAGATRLKRESMRLQAEARERVLQARTAEVTDSRSWRMTRPLRMLGATARRLRQAKQGVSGGGSST